jgi:hypothetical protein
MINEVEVIQVREIGFIHISEWTILPWIGTDPRGWEFTWVFFRMARFWLTKAEYEEYMSDDDDDDLDGDTIH